MTCFEIHHVVGLEETSVVGNVYFTNYLLWQGHCRERFLKDHCPEVLTQLERREIAFFTKSCACEWRGEWGFSGLDDVVIRMRLARFRGGRMWLEFGYVHAGRPTEVVATGTQEVHCKARRGELWMPACFPEPLVRALIPFADGEELRSSLQEALEYVPLVPVVNRA